MKYISKAVKEFTSFFGFTAIAAFALGCSSAAQAQEKEAVEEIVVTGSHIKRDEFSAAVPISVIDSEEFSAIFKTSENSSPFTLQVP